MATYGQLVMLSRQRLHLHLVAVTNTRKYMFKWNKLSDGELSNPAGVRKGGRVGGERGGIAHVGVSR